MQFQDIRRVTQNSSSNSVGRQQQQQINLNFQIIPTAQGPKIVQKGVAVKPGILDNLFSQLKYQNQQRPVSARTGLRGDSSFHSSSSWDGAAHFRSKALRIGKHKGDRPGLGRHYNPTKNRRGNSAHRPGDQNNNSGHNTYSHHTVTESGGSTTRAANANAGQHYYNRNQPGLEISNVDEHKDSGSGGRGSDHPYMRIDAQSQTDLQDFDADEEAKAGTGRSNPAAYDVGGSVSPDGRRLFTVQADKYASTMKSVGAGQGLFSASDSVPRQASEALNITPMRGGKKLPADFLRSADQTKFQNGLSSLDHPRKSGEDVHIEIGHMIGDPMCSTIDKLEENRAVGENGENPADLSASFYKNIGEIQNNFNANGSAAEETTAKYADNLHRKSKEFVQDGERVSNLGDLIRRPQDSKASREKMIFDLNKQSINDQRTASWDEEEKQAYAYQDTMSFAAARNTIGAAKLGDDNSSGALFQSPQQMDLPIGTTPGFDSQKKTSGFLLSAADEFGNKTAPKANSDAKQRYLSKQGSPKKPGPQLSSSASKLNKPLTNYENDKDLPNLGKNSHYLSQPLMMTANGGGKPTPTLGACGNTDTKSNGSPDDMQDTDKKPFDGFLVSSNPKSQRSYQNQNSRTQLRNGDENNFYNLENQKLDLFTSKAQQSTFDHFQNINEAQNKMDQDKSNKSNDDNSDIHRVNSIASQLQWQASLGGENDTPRDLNNQPLIAVKEEESAVFQKKTTSMDTGKLQPQTHSRKGSTGKRLVMKKKKKGGKSSTSLNMSGIPSASQTMKGRSVTGRISPSMMRVESVKSFGSSSKLGVGGKMKRASPKPTASRGMVLKSNVAMAADLPKSLKQKSVKKTPNFPSDKTSNLKKKVNGAVLNALKKPKKDASQKSDGGLATPNKLMMTPPSLELVTSLKVAPAEEQKTSTPVGAITLISVKPRMKQITTTADDSYTPPPEQPQTPKESVDQNSGAINPMPTLKHAQSEFIAQQSPQPKSAEKLYDDSDLEALAAQSFTDGCQSQRLIEIPGGQQLKSTKGPRRLKGDRKVASSMKNVQEQSIHNSSRRTSRSPAKSQRKLQELEVPPEYDTESDHVVEYMLGDKAIEIEAPLYQVNISSKLIYQLTLSNGDEPPAFIKFTENKFGRKVIRIRQRETTGVQKLYQLNLEVRNPETNVSGVYKCRVFVRPGTKLLLKKSLFQSPVEYSIKGPATILQMPVYSAKHDDLDFFLERIGDVIDLPNFIRISRDVDGNKVIKLQGNHINEQGVYALMLIARDKVTRVINDEFEFTVIGTPGIEVKHLPKEYEEEIKVDPNQTCIQLAMPIFNLETVKEEEQMPLEYSLVMRDGTKVPEYIFIKTLDDGEHIIELKAAELPPGLNAVFEVQLKVYDPNVDATQLIPISVKCPEPNLMLTLKDTNFPEEINYQIGSKEILVKVPQYERNDGKPMSEPVLLTLGGQKSTTVSRIAQIYTNEQGEQFFRVKTFDQKSKGNYEVKIYATEQNSGLNNQDASFRLCIQDSVLTLTETPNVCFMGKTLDYQPKGPPTFIPLPQYTVQRAQIQFTLVSIDPNVEVPPFVRIQGDHLIVEGSQNPTHKDYNLKLQAFDPISESKEELDVKITSNIYQIILEKIPFANPVEFYVGDEIMLPIPVYREEPFSGELSYALEIQGAGMMLAGIELASIVYTEDGKPKIKIAGGKNSNKGTYQITVSACEKTLGVSNKEATFILEAKPQLKMLTRPTEFDQMPPMEIDQVYKIPVPTFATKKRLRYQIQEKGTDDMYSCPRFITVKCPKQAQPYIEIKCDNKHDLPSKMRYEFELITCENIRHNVENVQDFNLEFNLQPRLALLKFDVQSPVRYSLKQGPLEIPLPTYTTHIVEIQNLDMMLVSDFTGLQIPFATIDRQRQLIIINADNDGFEGLHDISVVVSLPPFEKPHSTSPIKAVNNKDAKFRVEIGPSAASQVVERSSETLGIQDVQSDDLQIVKSGGYNRNSKTPSKNDKSQKEPPLQIGEKISNIDENDDIPIYYSDQSMDDMKQPTTPDVMRTTDRKKNRGNRRATDEYHQSRNNRNGMMAKEGSSPRIKMDRVQQQTNTDDEVVVVAADGGPDRRHNKQYKNRSDGDNNYDNIMVDENPDALPKEQVELLLRENEEIRRQIADVKNQMDQSMVNLANQTAIHHQQPNPHMHIQEQANQQQMQLQQQQAQQLHASMNLLNNLNNHQTNQSINFQQQNAAQPTIAALIANSLDEAFLQEEQILNNQLKQRIEQSKLRQIQQMNELERMRNDPNQGQASQQQQLLNHYLTETNGQGREKDIRLRQLRTQLAQLQEQRASLRKQCTTLKQKEDDLHSDLFTRDQQLKQLTKRNEEQSTKVSSVFSEIDKVVFRNENLRTEVSALEEQLEDKKQIVSKNKARLRDLNGNQTELEENITAQKHQVTKLRLENESAKRRLDHQEQLAQTAPVRMENPGHERLQTATFSPPSTNDSKAHQHYQRGSQLQQQQQHQTRQSMNMPLKLVPLEYEMQDHMQGYGPSSARNNGAHNNMNAGGYNTMAADAMNSAQMSAVFSHAGASNYQPQDVTDQPPAGMPTGRKSSSSSAQQQFASTMLSPQRAIQQQQQHHYQYQSQQQSPMTGGFHHQHQNMMTPHHALSRSGPIQTFQPHQFESAPQFATNSSEKQIVNPRPQAPYRPRENNIFGGADVVSPREDPDSERFRTTYTQFANREKFRGLRSGEHGGKRAHNVPQDGVCRLEQLRRNGSNLYPNVPVGMASGMTTDMRRQREHSGGNLLPQSGKDFGNYEKKYRY